MSSDEYDISRIDVRDENIAATAAAPHDSGLEPYKPYEFYLTRQYWGEILENADFTYTSFTNARANHGYRFGTKARWTPPGATQWDHSPNSIGVRLVGSNLQWANQGTAVSTPAGSNGFFYIAGYTIGGIGLFGDDLYYNAAAQFTITFDTYTTFSASDLTIVGTNRDTFATESLSASITGASPGLSFTVNIVGASFVAEAGESFLVSFGPLTDLNGSTISVADVEFVYKTTSGIPVLTDAGAVGGGHKFVIDFLIPAGLSLIQPVNIKAEYYDQYFDVLYWWNHAASNGGFLRGKYNGSELIYGVDVSNIAPLTATSYEITIPIPVKSNGVVIGTPTTLEVWVDPWPSGLPSNPVLQTLYDIPPLSNHVTI